MVIFSIFPIFGQIEYIIVSIFSKLHRFFSILVEIHHFFKKKVLQNNFTISWGGGGGFFIFVKISYVAITLGEGGVSPNLTNVINFTVFWMSSLPKKKQVYVQSHPILQLQQTEEPNTNKTLIIFDRPDRQQIITEPSSIVKLS